MEVIQESRKDFGLGGVGIVLGIMAVFFALGMHAWGDVRAQERAVSNNVRKLAAAAEQYYVEYNTSSVARESLVGPDNYVKALMPFGEEIYPSEFQRGAPIVVTNLPGDRSLTYSVVRDADVFTVTVIR